MTPVPRRGPPVAWVLTGAVFGTVLVVFAIGLGFLARSTILAYRAQLVEKTATIGQVVAD